MTTKALPFPEPLYERYRPKRIADFIGLVKVKRIIEPFVKAPFESNWLFLGGSGLGKTTLVQAIADEINAELHEIPSAECDLERVLHVTGLCTYGAFNFAKGTTSVWHVVGIHEANWITQAAQKSLVSKMDSTNPPPKTIFILTANTKETIEPKLLTRLTEISFTEESVEDELPDYLAKIYKKEGGRHPLDFAAISKLCKYNVRDALLKLQVELLIGTNRKGLPTEDLKILPTHQHECEKCRKPWKCSQLKCKLPHVSVCPECGGSRTVGQERAKKAWKTIRDNIAEELKQKPKKKGKAA